MGFKKNMVLFLCLSLCSPMLASNVSAEEAMAQSISGNGVKVTFDDMTDRITLYKVDGGNELQMSCASEMGYPVVNGQAVSDFTDYSCTVMANTTGLFGTVEKMIITSSSPSTGLTRTYTLEVSADVADIIYTQTAYRAGETTVTPSWFVDNVFSLANHTNTIWSYNGGGEGPMHYYDTLQKIDLTDSITFSRENIQDCTAASIPVADIYSADGGITVGDASATRREVHTPVQEIQDSAQVSIKWPGKELAPNTDTAIGQSFITVHSGDYYVGLRGYKNAMEYLNVIMHSQGNIPESSYDLRWESWGWGSNWTIDLIIGKLDELQAAGVKQITLDDGWYTNAGDWELDPGKFPNGVADVQRLTNAIHAHGMTAILWWRPCDGGISSTLYEQHPEYYVQNPNGTTARLMGAGGANAGLGYALCPSTEGAQASHTEFVIRAMDVWGFDGFKGDFVWGMPKCYNPSHNHMYPEESTEKQSLIYKVSYEAMKTVNPNVFNLLCNCGTPQDYYSLPYMTQVATADPTSLDQTRRRVKAYKALLGDYFPVTTDHNSVWYPSAVGTGAVLIEKRAFSGADQTEYERWLNIANAEQLHRGRFIGELYSYGFDPYETYVIEKDGVMYYAFYRDGSKFAPEGYPEVELRGLDSSKLYRIVDYVNNRIVETNVAGDNAKFVNKFSTSLLVKAVEIDEPDDPSVVDPDWGYTIVDDRDEALRYSGIWYDDSNPSFSEETARYTSNSDASAEFTFAGKAIRWYGQKDSNFGTADVYLDGELIETINANGSQEFNVRLFEAVNLPAAVHTIKIVCKSGVIDIDRLAYEAATPEPIYTKVNALDEQIIYTGTWTVENSDDFFMGTAKRTASDASAEFGFAGTSIRWYGRTSKNYGVAEVYIDGELVETVYTYGEEAAGRILFERDNLSAGNHTIKIVRNYGPIDVDYFAYIADVEENYELAIVDAMDEILVYSENWTEDVNTAFQNGTAKYTSTPREFVTLTYTGTSIRWYGQHDANFGVAEVYIDEELIETVNVNGEAAVQQLVFEKTDLEYGQHTVKIVCVSPVIDIDYFTYEH